jgi:hypothetical protein
MQPIYDSGITLTFPDNNYFRFEACQGYKDIQNNFKEMDVCWYDSTNNTLYIIELKEWDYTLAEEQDANVTAQKIKEIKDRRAKSHIHTLLKKSIDSVSMFISVLLNKPYASKISACAPFSITQDTQIKLLTIVKTPPSSVDYISSLYTEYKAHFKPYATLFGIKAYVVMTKEQAMREFSWVS